MISPIKSPRRESFATRRRRGSVEASTCLDMTYIRLGGDSYTPQKPGIFAQMHRIHFGARATSGPGNLDSERLL